MLSKLFPKENNIVIPSKPALAPIVGVIGAKGGVGTTTVAVNLAATIASTHIQTTILDANLQQPDVAPMVGKEPRHSLMDLLSRSSDIDRQLFEAMSVEISDGNLSLTLLSPPLNGEAGIKTDLTSVVGCMKNIRNYCDFWIIDMPRNLDKHLVTMADLCDKIVLVFEATVAGVATSHRWLKTFSDLGYDNKKIVCVLNRAGSKFKAVEQELGGHFGEHPIFRIPNASQTIWDCSTHGIPTVLAHPNHPYSKAMFKLADYVMQPALVRFNDD